MNELIFEKDDLPRGWVKITLQEIATKIHYGYTSKSTTDEIGPKYLRITDIRNNKVNWNTVPYCKINSQKISQFILRNNDLVFARTGSVGKSLLLKNPPQSIFASYLIRVILTHHIIPSYISFFFQSPYYWNQIYAKKIGIVQSNFNATKLSQLLIFLPPLNEQKRIVAKIESIFAQIDAIKEQFEMLASQVGSNVGILDEMRNSILRHAFEGRLVPQNPKDESSEILLKQIHRGSEKELVFEKNASFPKGWIKVVLKNLVENIQKINPRETSDKMYYYCDIDSINNSKLKITTPKQVIGSEAPSRARQLIKKHDILFSTVRTYLKNIAIVPDNLDGQLASTGFCVIRPTINHKFVFYYVQSKSFLDVLNNIQRGTSYPAVRNNDVLSTLIPLPPLNEQKRIVSKIESIFGNIDTLNLFYFILLGNLFTNLRYFIILYMPHTISDQ